MVIDFSNAKSRKMKWLFKDKKSNPTLERLVKAINRFNANNLVSIDDSTYYSAALPFYSDFKLYTFFDLSFTPYLEIHLLDNECNTFILDGTQKPFHEANAISPLRLTSENVYQYAMMVLGNTLKNESSYRLVSSINEINFTTEPTKEQYHQIASSIRTAKIKKEKEYFIIKTTLLYSDSVFEASINVTYDGHVSIIKEKKLLENMPIQEMVLE